MADLLVPGNTKVIEDRAFQDEAVEGLRRHLRLAALTDSPLRRRVILQAETGSGKTVMACKMIAAAQKMGSRCLFLARGRELVFQCSRTLDALGVQHGILMRGKGRNQEPVQVASKDSFYSWVVKRDMPPPAADLVVVDECHGSISATWLKVLELYSKAVIVGLTATPVRGDGRGLGGYYGGMVQAAKPSRLIEMGLLVPMKAYAPYRPNMKGVKRDRNGDWQADSAAKRMDRAQLVGDVVKHWKQLAGGKPTAVYACNVAHSLHLRDEFLAAGVRAVHVDGTTADEERDEIPLRMEGGEVEVVCNVGVYTQGVDIPCLEVACVVRPTRSLGLYRQMVGRAKRPYARGDYIKEGATLIDHSGSVYLHGLPDEDIDWVLDANVKIEKLRDKQKPPGQKEPFHCPKCHAIWAQGGSCPECGHVPQKKGKALAKVDGVLVEVTANPEPNFADRKKYWNYCLAVMAHRGRSCEQAAFMYKKKFGEWPGTGNSVGLPRIPDPGRWKQPVAVLFPGFIRGK